MAKPCTSDVTIYFDTSDGISECNDTSSPSLIVGIVWIVEWSVGGIELVKRSVEFLMVDDAGDGEDFSAGGVALLGVAAVAGHPANITVSFFGPDGGLEGESLLRSHSLPVVRVELASAQPEGQ